MIKTIQTREEAYIQFTDEEIIELGLKQGDTFTVIPEGDGFLFKKNEKFELDLAEWPREILEMLIKESCENNITVNEVINSAVETFLNEESNKNEYHGEF